MLTDADADFGPGHRFPARTCSCQARLKHCSVCSVTILDAEKLLWRPQDLPRSKIDIDPSGATNRPDGRFSGYLDENLDRARGGNWWWFQKSEPGTAGACPAKWPPGNQHHQLGQRFPANRRRSGDGHRHHAQHSKDHLDCQRD